MASEPNSLKTGVKIVILDRAIFFQTALSHFIFGIEEQNTSKQAGYKEELLKFILLGNTI